MMDLIEALKHPEYVHVLLNPVPVYALSMGILALALGFLLRSRQAQIVGLIIVIISCASAWPVAYFGHQAHEHLEDALNDEAKTWVDHHSDRADRGVYGLYLTALLGLAALLVPARFAKSAKVLPVLTLVAAIGALGLAGWISHAGGQIRHSEFRQGPPPAADDTGSHGHH
jgi:hypothetical protein